MSDFPLLLENVVCTPFHIEPTVAYGFLSPEITQHVASMEQVVRKCIPENLLQLSAAEFKKILPTKLPLLTWSAPSSAPGCIEICCLTLSSKEDVVGYQIIDILRAWIIPGKCTPVLSSQILSFLWDLFPHETFLVLQAKLLMKNSKELNKAILHLPSLSTHLLSALKNPLIFRNFFAEHPLLENIKNAEVHKNLGMITEKFPSFFDASIFLEMGRFFSLSPKSFSAPRSARLVTKIITSHFLMRAHLVRQLALYPERRHLKLHYIRTELNFFFGSKPVLGIAIAIAPLDKHEFFEESHILEAAQSLIPDVQSVQGSFYSHQGVEDPLCSIYVELEKKDGSRFSFQEIHLLKKDFEAELKRRIEKLVPSIFMIRNEEETMRNILLLSEELKYLSDLPQVMISLDKQTSSEMIFVVILVRLVKPGQLSLLQSFHQIETQAVFVPDRLQHVGFLRKNYPKEANVFHVKLPKDSSLLRPDYSVNFYLARQKVANVLQEAVGPFRDYNGGMILKQGELFYQFKESFPSIAQKNSELLENFFFSLNPIETQATLPLSSLQILFRQFLEAKDVELPKKEHYFLKIEEKRDQLFSMIRIQDATFKEELRTTLIRYDLWSRALVHTSLSLQGSLYIGCILLHFDSKHQMFIDALHEAIQSWKNRIKKQQIVRLSFSHLPSSLDPRMVGDEISATIAKMLFEGLTRLDEKGHPSLAIAQSVEVSKNATQYLFKLRKCYWTDGSLITAYDFEHSWKKILSPSFSTPLSHFLHVIKNAQEAKENRCPIEHVGITALNPSTLAVDLEYPCPEFLELTALPTYYPVPHYIDKKHPDWGLRDSEDFVCNGPFLLKKTSHHARYELVKNSLYWEQELVKIQQINLSKDSSIIAHSMFQNEEIDWLGMPLRPWEPFFEEHLEAATNTTLSGVHWALFNTEKFPFQNSNLRKAFALAIDPQELVSRLPYTCFPAIAPLPPSHTMNDDLYPLRGNLATAVELFEIALQELGLTRKQLPLITITFANTVLREKTARYLAEKWRALFQIPCRIEKCEYSVFFSKLMKADFQCTTMHWKSFIDHPLYTLKIFKYQNDVINFPRWFHPEYHKWIEEAQKEIDPNKKIQYLSAAEKLLAQECPLIPLYYEKEKIIKKRHLRKVLYSASTNHFDLKNAYIER